MTTSSPLTAGIVTRALGSPTTWLTTADAPDAVGFCFKTNRQRPTEASP